MYARKGNLDNNLSIIGSSNKSKPILFQTPVLTIVNSQIKSTA